MAIMTEEQQDDKQPIKDDNPKKHHQKTHPNPFTFWFYFTVGVSIITPLFISLSSLLSSQDPKSWFLSLPTELRQHYSNGRIIKTDFEKTPIEVFTIESNPKETEKVVFVHGLGLNSYSFRESLKLLGSKGLHVMAFDIPGSGFSDKSIVVEDSSSRVIGFWDVCRLIKKKGVFWAFDRMVETGQVPYEEIMKYQDEISKRNVVRPIELTSEEMGKVLGQVIDTLRLAPVHLVLHDTSLLMCANWISENSGLVRSVTLIDTGRNSALPLWALGILMVRDVVQGFSFVYENLIRSCCSKGLSKFNANAHRVLLRGRDGGKSVLGMGKNLNYSFDVAEWGSLSGVKDIPMLVLWSSQWSKEWSEEGRRFAEALPSSKFIEHSGGRWAQEDIANELAENIHNFISLLPKSVRQSEEPIPEHNQRVFGVAEDSHHHHHGHSDHGHGHATGYMDAYGLSHGHGHLNNALRLVAFVAAKSAAAPFGCSVCGISMFEP
ncbi:hypothetical protein ACFE04_006430 [Oxalis oulophora]